MNGTIEFLVSYGYAALFACVLAEAEIIKPLRKSAEQFSPDMIPRQENQQLRHPGLWIKTLDAAKEQTGESGVVTISGNFGATRRVWIPELRHRKARHFAVNGKESRMEEEKGKRVHSPEFRVEIAEKMLAGGNVAVMSLLGSPERDAV